jgi:hypothetical protein
LQGIRSEGIRSEDMRISFESLVCRTGLERPGKKPPEVYKQLPLCTSISPHLPESAAKLR